jgi:hypothetical protein
VAIPLLEGNPRWTRDSYLLSGHMLQPVRHMLQPVLIGDAAPALALVAPLRLPFFLLRYFALRRLAARVRGDRS